MSRRFADRAVCVGVAPSRAAQHALAVRRADAPRTHGACGLRAAPGAPAAQRARPHLRAFAAMRACAVLCLLVAAAGCGATSALAPDRAASADGALPEEVKSLYQRGLSALDAGDLQSARGAFSELRARRPELPGPVVNLAVIARLENDTDTAMGLLDTVLAAAPDFAPAHHQRALLLREQGDFLAADEAYARALALDPEYDVAHFNRAVLNDLLLARPQVALEHFTRYQALQAQEDERVARWIVELTRRVERDMQQAGVAR